MLLDDNATNRKSNAQAILLGRIERRKQVFHSFVGKAITIVSDTNLHDVSTSF